MPMFHSYGNILMPLNCRRNWASWFIMRRIFQKTRARFVKLAKRRRSAVFVGREIFGSIHPFIDLIRRYCELVTAFDADPFFEQH